MRIRSGGPRGGRIALRLYIRNHFPARISSGNFGSSFFNCYRSLEETSSVTISSISVWYGLIYFSEMEFITSEADVTKLMKWVWNIGRWIYCRSRIRKGRLATSWRRGGTDSAFMSVVWALWPGVKTRAALPWVLKVYLPSQSATNVKSSRAQAWKERLPDSSVNEDGSALGWF